MAKSKKVLITGGAGFIGYHLGKHLSDLKYDVTLVDNFFRAKNDDDLKNLLKRPNVNLKKADLTKISSWNGLGSGYDHVYHLVAVNGTGLFYDMPEEVLRINITTTLNAVEWFKNKNSKGKILFTSSNEAYAGALESFGKLQLPTPENVPLLVADVFNPRWSYAGTKLIGEQIMIHYSNSHKFRMVIVRPHNFYGPRAGYHHVIPEFIKRINDRVDPFPIYGASDTRSFCYIDDAVRAMRLVMESKKTDGQIYHIGTDEETKIKDLALNLFKIAGWTPKKIDIKSSLAGSVKRRLPAIIKIKKDIGWEPKTKLAGAGLQKTFEWYSQNSNDKKVEKIRKV